MLLSSRTVFCSTSEFVCAGGSVRGEGGRDGGFGLGDSRGLITFGVGALALAATSLVAGGFGGVRTEVEGGGDLVLGDGGAFVEVGKICFRTGEVCGDLVRGGGGGGATGAFGGDG